MNVIPNNILGKLPNKLQRFIKYLKVSNEDSFLLVKNYYGFDFLKILICFLSFYKKI